MSRLRHRAAAAARRDLPEVPLRLPRLRAGVAQATACAPRWIDFGCATRLAAPGSHPARRDGVPGAAGSADRAGQRAVSRPAVLPDHARAGRARPAHLSVAEDLGRRLQHGRGGLFVRDPAARRGPARADPDLRDRHQRRGRCRKPRPASTTSIGSPDSRRTIASRARATSLSDYYTAAYGRAVFDKTLRQHIVFSDHSLATDSVFAEVQLISCRNVLIYFNRSLQDRAFGLFRDALCRRGFLGLGAKETLALLAHADAFDGARAATNGSTRSERPRDAMAARLAPRRCHRHRRLGRRRRGAVSGCCRRCRRPSPAPCCVVLHLPRERPSLLADDLPPEVRGCRCARRRTRSRSRPGRSTSRRPDYHLLVDRGPAARALDGRARALLAAVDRRAVRVRRGGLWPAAARHPPHRRNDDGAAGLEAIHRSGGITCVQDPETAQAPLHGRGRPRRVHPRTSSSPSAASPTCSRLRGR